MANPPCQHGGMTDRTDADYEYLARFYDLRFLGAEGSPTQLFSALVENTKDLSTLVGIAALDFRLHGVELHHWSLEFEVEGSQVAVTIAETGTLGDYRAWEKTRFHMSMDTLLVNPELTEAEQGLGILKGWYINVKALQRAYTNALRESGDWDRTKSAHEDFVYTLEVEGKYGSWVRRQR